jgi:hypothetical protein
VRVLSGEFDELAEHFVAHLGFLNGVLENGLCNINSLGFSKFLLVCGVCVPSVGRDECRECYSILCHGWIVVEGALEGVTLECNVCVRGEELVSVVFKREFVRVERGWHFHTVKVSSVIKK